MVISCITTFDLYLVLLYSSPVELINALLHHVVDVDLDTMSTGSTAWLPVSELALRSRLLKMLPRLAKLARLDFSEYGTRLVLKYLRLPKHVLELTDTRDDDDNNNNKAEQTESSMDQSRLLDTTITHGQVGVVDITLNATILDQQSPAVHDNLTDFTEPNESEFLIVEILLKHPAICQQLLPNLHAFVFTGDPDMYLGPRWNAARCLLRSQLGLMLRPRLSLEELRASLLRLATLVRSDVLAYKRLLMSASVSRTSSYGDTYCAFNASRIPDTIRQLLELSDHCGGIAGVCFAGNMLIDHDVLQFRFIQKLLWLLQQPQVVTKSGGGGTAVTENSDLCGFLLRLFDHLRQSPRLWESIGWLWRSIAQAEPSTYRHLFTLLEQLLSDALIHRPVAGGSGQPDRLFTRVLSCMFEWPVPDPRIDKFLIEKMSHVGATTVTSGQARRLVTAALLRAATCSSESLEQSMRDCSDAVSASSHLPRIHIHWFVAPLDCLPMKMAALHCTLCNAVPPPGEGCSDL